MKVSKFVNLMAIGLALAFAGSGCKHKPVGVTNIPSGARTGPGENFNTTPIAPDSGLTGGNDGSMTGIPANPAGSHTGWKQDASTLSAHTVYFAFDSSVVRSDEKSKVAAVADYLKNNFSAAVQVDGHCDERGTEEYNRSLGERRALALREDLVALGVEAGRVDTVSFGKDKPAVDGHDESAWRKNRRGEFILLTPP